MSTSNSVTISINSNDVSLLKSGGYSLFVFGSVKASGTGGMTSWYKLDEIMTHNIISTENSFTAYNSTSEITDNSVIQVGNSVAVNQGDLVTIDSSGNLNVTTNGEPNCIAYVNGASQIYTVGIIQKIQKQENINCAFSIFGGGAAKVIQPLNKIALIFSTADIAVNTVVSKTMSAGIIVDFDGANENSREVTYRTSDGWTSNTESWVKQFEAFEDMNDLLIVPSSNLLSREKSIEKTHKSLK